MAVAVYAKKVEYIFISRDQNAGEYRKMKRKTKYPLKVWQILNILVKTLKNKNCILGTIKSRLNRNFLLLSSPEFFFLQVTTQKCRH